MPTTPSIKHILAGILLLVLLVPAAGAQTGGGLLGRIAGGNTDDLLPPEQAFPVSVEQVAEDVLAVRWQTPPGYYLYRDRLAFDIDGNTITRQELPDGEKTDDPTFGMMEVYYDELQVYLQLDAPVRGNETLHISFQGCSDTGVCYPPMNTSVELAGGGISTGFAGGGAGGGGPPGVGGGLGDLEGLLTGSNVPLMLLGFLLAGILLAFTACMYPLIPILSGLVAGDSRRSTGRAFWLSMVFIQSTAITYALAGAVAGLTGAAIQADLQSPWVLSSFAVVFVVLALAMFGLYNIQMPAALQTRLDALSRKQRGGTFIGAGIMGVLSALIVGACSGPALIAALVFISNTGDAALGGAALYAMAMGMGLPLLLIGTAAGRWLPRSGPWMVRAKQAFGFLFLAVAIWMVDRFLPGPVILALWAALLTGMAVWLGLLDRPARTVGAGLRLRQLTSLAAAGWALVLLAGAAAGGSSFWQPLAPLAQQDASRPAVEWQRVHSVDELEQALAAASAAGRPAVVDVYADWCVYCVRLDQRTFSDTAVVRALQNAATLKVDVTRMSADDRALLARLDVFLPPAVIFFDAGGEERREQRLVGFVGPEEFLQRKQQATGNRSVL
ncbi:MAG: protein-disulfide reductase DsbD [Ectothiorhodospiraceae bacterium]|nr:protein-disulfide reductase DsbD [Ectothiorhodospiraceae bacterium]